MPTFPGKFLPGQMPASDGAGGWKPGAIITPWQTLGPLPISAVTTAPTKGTVVLDTYRARRVGNLLRLRGNFRQTAGGSVGSGNYLVPLPFGLSADLSLVDIANMTTWDTAYASVVGTGIITNTGSAAGLFPMLYSATQLALLGHTWGTTVAFWSSTYYQTGYATLALSFDAEIPILGWNQ